MTCRLESLDPHERKFYLFDFTANLGGLAEIDVGTASVALDEASVALGVMISGSAHAPQITPTTVAVCLEVAPPNRFDAAFDRGHTAKVEVSFNTTATPAETLQFSFPVRVKQAG